MEETKAEETKPNNNNKKRLGAVVLTVLVIIGAVAIFFYMRYKATHISTDDAYIDGYIHTIASKDIGDSHEYLCKSQPGSKKRGSAR